MSNATTMSGVKPFNSFMDYTKLDRNRERTVVFYGRVSTEHEAQLSALENQIQWYTIPTGMSSTSISMLRLPIEYNKTKGQPPKNTQNCDIFGS